MAWPCKARPRKSGSGLATEGGRPPGRRTLGCSSLGTTEGKTLQVGFPSVDSSSTGHRVFLPLDQPRTTLTSSVSRAVPFHPPPRKNAHVHAGRRRHAAPRAQPGYQGLGSVGPRGRAWRRSAVPPAAAARFYNSRATGVLFRVFKRFGPAHRRLEAVSRCVGKLPGRGLCLPVGNSRGGASVAGVTGLGFLLGSPSIFI